eukprot:6180711-Pleurochrysis_carterae.AAC.4
MARLATHRTLRGAFDRPPRRLDLYPLQYPLTRLSLFLVLHPRGWWAGVSICYAGAGDDIVRGAR